MASRPKYVKSPDVYRSLLPKSNVLLQTPSNVRSVATAYFLSAKYKIIRSQSLARERATKQTLSFLSRVPAE